MAWILVLLCNRVVACPPAEACAAVSSPPHSIGYYSESRQCQSDTVNVYTPFITATREQAREFSTCLTTVAPTTSSVSPERGSSQAAPKCAVCNGVHASSKYHMLLRLGPGGKLSKVHRMNLCFSCLKPLYQSRKCEEGVNYRVSPCRRHHATILHGVS